MRRLLTIGHSYVVAQNRRLAHEMALAGQGRWDVTAVAPEWLAGDLRPIRLEPIADEQCRVVPLRMAVGRVPHLRHYRGLDRVMAEGWDVVHCWEEPYVAAGWQVARGAPRGSRLVMTSFQNILKRYPPPFSWMERAVRDRVDAWIPFGRTAQETLDGRTRRGPVRPSRVIAPGVDTGHFTPDPSAGARVRASLGWDDAPVVGFLGRLVAEKGIGVLLAALDRLRSPWRALFVGDGPMRRRIEAFGAEHPGRVEVVAGVTHDEVPSYLNAMDVLCAPSQTSGRWREQFGRMLIEAMACGVAVVASDSGEMPHVVGDAGIIVPEGDVAAWAVTLDRLLPDDPRRSSLGGAGLERARAHFAWPRIARRHLAFLEELCT